MSPHSPISELKGVTKANAGALRVLGIETVKDLLFCLPTRYEDYTSVVPIAMLEADRHCTTIVELKAVVSRRPRRQRLTMLEATISDASGAAKVVWFNQPYVVSRLKSGETYRFSGKPKATKFGIRFVNPFFEPAERQDGITMRILPVYPLAAGLSQAAMRRIVASGLSSCGDLEDSLDDAMRARLSLPDIRAAIRWAHAPASMEQAGKASRRLAFDELFKMHLAVACVRASRSSLHALAVPFHEDAVKNFVAGLPFPLTDDQRKAAWEIISDLKQPTPMHRLLDGDVGSGKTAVAAIAMADIAASGNQSALMAPTEILAKQHYETLRSMFAASGVRIALWTNGYARSVVGGAETIATSKHEREALRERIASGEAGITVGTHALLEGPLRFRSLAFVVIDEQHRFGVNSRRLLREKSGEAGVEPHLLSMTATPIPRTLALTAYGDLDVSIIRQKPKDRLRVITKVIEPRQRRIAYEAVRKEIAVGRQAFIICPLIDPSDALGATSVAEELERIRAAFPEARSAALHGRLSTDAREEVMSSFLSGEADILVSTSVVEVGVDVPNATLMLIEGAERFGLAQLHQFRGRVGRGARQSYCFLFPSAAGAGQDRLETLAATHDGFELAERDLRMRGPGDILGEAQSGYSRLAIASLADVELLKAARSAAQVALAEDPGLSRYPELRARMESTVERAHFE